MANPPVPYQWAEDYREEVRQHGQAACSQLLDVYGKMWLEVKAMADRDVAEYMSSQGALGPLEQQSLIATLADIQKQIASFDEYADEVTREAQKEAIAASRRYVSKYGGTAEGPTDPLEQALLAARPFGARRREIEFLIGRTRSGTPIGQILDSLGEETAAKVRQVMIDSVMGTTPVSALIQPLKKTLGGHLGQVLRIVRTETSNAARESLHLWIVDDPNIGGWRWLANRKTCCIACFLQHGTLHKKEERLEDHANGMCVMELVPSGSEAEPPESAEEAFEKLPLARQEQLIGKVGVEAWQRGLVKLTDFSQMHYHPVYGSTLQRPSVKSLLGREKYEELRRDMRERAAAERRAAEEARRAAMVPGVYVERSGTPLQALDVDLEGLAEWQMFSNERLASGQKLFELQQELIPGLEEDLQSAASLKSATARRLAARAVENNADLVRLTQYLEERAAGVALENAPIDTLVTKYRASDKYGAEVITDPVNRLHAMLVGNWAQTSADTDPLAIALQMAASEEFGVPLPPHYKGEVVAEARGLMDSPQVNVRGALREFVRNQYALTQESLAAQEIDGMFLYRGMRMFPKDIAVVRGNQSSGGVAAVQLQPLSSFSASGYTSAAFAHMDRGQGDSAVIWAAYVPRERIVSYSGTGFGCFEESEVVVMGGGGEAFFLLDDEKCVYNERDFAVGVLEWLSGDVE